MKNIRKYEVLSYIYDNGNLNCRNSYNGGKLIGIDNIEKLNGIGNIGELNKNYLSCLRDYVKFSTIGKSGWYLTDEGMIFVEDNRGLIKKIELFASDSPYIGSLTLGFIGGLIVIALEKLIAIIFKNL